MIIAGFMLLAVGSADLIRQFIPRRGRWIGYLVCAVLLAFAGIAMGAIAEVVLAIAVALAWRATSPPDGSGRGGFWPAAVLGLLCIVAIAAFPTRTVHGVFGPVGILQTPIGALSPGQVILIVGALVFLLESANILVRTALRGEPLRSDADADGAAGNDSGPVTRAVQAHTLKGGRLIGPLERILVFALTLTGAYTMLAAVLAAKGIVRFPEISRDGASGDQAEYFLVGSLVSWVTALAAAFLAWWAIAG